MVGPTVSELKVKNMHEYHFVPRNFLREIIEIFLHLSGSRVSQSSCLHSLTLLHSLSLLACACVPAGLTPLSLS